MKKEIKELLRLYRIAVESDMAGDEDYDTVEVEDTIIDFVADQQAELIDDMGIWDLVKIADKILTEKYPRDVWTGVSGDSGAKFIVEFRKLTDQLLNQLDK